MNPRTTSENRLQNWAPMLILGVALVVRLVYLVQYQQSDVWSQLTVDNWYHHNWAGSLADGNVLGDTTYFRAPFYTYCLGLLYAILGSSLWVARLFGLLIGMGSVAMTFALGRKLIDRRAGIIAASIHALYPLTLYFEGELLLDSLFTLLVQITIYCFLRWRDSEKAADLLWTGLACGLAAITRPTALVAVPLILVWVLARRGLGSGTREATLFVVGLGLVIAPVFLRNVLIADDPVLIASQGGVNLYIGNHDGADGSSATMPEPLGYNWRIEQVSWQAEKDIDRELKPGEVSDYWRNRAFVWTADNPGRFLELYLKKVYFQIGDLEISNNRSLRSFWEEIPLLKYNPLRFGLIFPLAVLGLLVTLRKNRGMIFVLLFLCLYVAAVSLFFYNSRFRLPLMPYYFVLAAAGAGMLKDQLTSRSSRFVTCLGLAVVAGMLSFSTAYTIPRASAPQDELSSGLTGYRAQDYVTALSHFTAAGEIDPEFPEVNLNIGACYFRLGQIDSARIYFERERQLHPGRAKTYHNLASFDLVSGGYQEAAAWSRTAVRLAPYDVTANILLVRSLGADSSIADDELLLEISSARDRTNDDLFLLNEAAALLSRRGDQVSAARLSTAAAEVKPPPIETDSRAFEPDFRHAHESFVREKARAWHLLGYIAGLEGNLDGAIGYLRRAVAGDPKLAPAYLNLIAALLSSGQVAEADTLISTALDRFPDDPTFRQISQSR
ncbi:MAG: tetratricopeptide repeat protein [bacterium]|nr:tetratricopeptide repeat protein [bacterium]